MADRTWTPPHDANHTELTPQGSLRSGSPFRTDGEGPIRPVTLDPFERRLHGEADGYDHVFCNGSEIVRHGEFTENRPGAMLCSGTDTSGTGIA